VAAISVSGASVYVLQNREAIISSLLDTSRKISRELGGQVV
jgi:DNA-binding IclR family transcriptional regulator